MTQEFIKFLIDSRTIAELNTSNFDLKVKNKIYRPTVIDDEKNGDKIGVIYNFDEEFSAGFIYYKSTHRVKQINSYDPRNLRLYDVWHAIECELPKEFQTQN